MLKAFIGWFLGLFIKDDPLYDEEMGYVPRNVWDDIQYDDKD